MKLTKPMLALRALLIERIWYFALRGLAVPTLLYLVLPVLVIAPLSFSPSTFPSYPIPSYSLCWYQNLVTSDEWRTAAKNSFIVAPTATIVATVLGTLTAIGLNKADFRSKGLLMAVLVLPMIVPAVVVGIGMYLLLVPLGLTNTYTGPTPAHVTLGAPLVVMTVLAALQDFNHSPVQASLSLGASPVMTFLRTTLLVIVPGVISGALSAFATSFDEMMVTLFLAGADQVTLSCQMLTGIRENISPTIATLATILIVSSTCLLLTFEWLRGRATAKAVA